ncbi:MAG: DEAD/DEAH box helicase family protein [Candidatus Saccharibacteria bacterium]
MSKSNFEFLQNNSNYQAFAASSREAELTIAHSPAACAILSRRALELAVRWLYSADTSLRLPYQDQLSSLIHEHTFKNLLDATAPGLFPLIKYIVKLGNVTAHTGTTIKRTEAALSLRNLHLFLAWLDQRYSLASTAEPFDESLLPGGEETRISRTELKELYDKLGASDQKLKDLVSENQNLREKLEKTVSIAKSVPFPVDHISEFSTRKHYIDLDLKDAGWVFGENCLEEVEVQGMPFGSGTGFADYVLFGDNGLPLAVVEAKKTSKDPKEGQQQALLYADCLEEKYGQRPVMFYTNGFEAYIWDDRAYPSRRVSGFYSKDELQLAIDRRKNRISLDHIRINSDITDRYYQHQAITAVCEDFSKGHRKALLVMATGSGKTRTVISLVDVLSRHEWVKNVLFLADRTALVRQAKNNFAALLPNMSLCNLLESKDDPNSRIVFSTYPTMMNAIDETKREDGQKLFTAGHFDLIIIDESHRSIYKKYQAIFDYFDAMLVGLTATPKDEVDKNTYHIFDLENGVPTYAYELPTAINDKYLVDHFKIETVIKFLQEGISYDELSEEDKEQFEETFEDDMPDYISSNELNTWLFNDDTIDKVLSILMEKGIKVDGGDKLGKTIIFAKNHKHAVRVFERFDRLFPGYNGEFARVIDNQVNYSQDLIDRFSDKEKMPQIAVSVDMLDTGIDIPEIVNLVFFKRVMSKSKFWQMIGRGTRLCPDLFGPDLNKQYFYIFDFCGNFEFFRVNETGKEARISPSITEKLFRVKVDLIRELQDLRFQDNEGLKQYRIQLVESVVREICALNRDYFMVKQHLRYVDKYAALESWQALGHIESEEIKEHLAALIIPSNENELAKRFDYLMLTIEIADLLNKNATKAKDSVVSTARLLSKLATIPQIVAKKEVITRVQTDEFWAIASVLDYEQVREALRDLIQFIERNMMKDYYTNFTDEILSTVESPGEYSVMNLESYYKKVNRYIEEHQDHTAIYKLKNNKRLTRQDVLTLEQILWGELGSKAEYEKAFGDTPLTLLVRKVAGLSQEAANEAFAEFLNDLNLDSKQSYFVKKVVDYIVKNGFVEDKAILQQDPINAQGGILDLFPTESALKIVSIIDSIKQNAEEVESA